MRHEGHRTAANPGTRLHVAADLAAGTAVVPAVPLSLGRGGLGLDVVPAVSFDTVQHLVSAAAGESPLVLTGRASRRGFRDRLGRLLDTLQGPTIPD